jgi:TRAP-type mannitol/chloroaromatic compound transport system permease small subunit
MVPSATFRPRRRGTWALSERSAVLQWQFGSACTDPGGLYSEHVTTVYQAGYDAHPAQGISDLLKAAAPLKGLKTIDSRLAAEANRAMAKNL